MEIKLIGVDLDGTLLFDHNSIDDYTFGILKKAHAKGIKIVPITGRPFSGMPKCILESEIFDHYITSNGAEIFADNGKTRLFSFKMDNESSLEIIEKLTKHDCMIEVFCDDFGYIEQKHYDHYKKTYTGTLLESYIFSSRKKVDSVLNFVKKNKKSCDEIFVICKNQAKRDELIEICKTMNGIQFCKLSDRFIEITKEGVDKGNALKVLCNELGIELAQTIAFGDGENDLEFLQMAGISVAMENARDEVKSKADIIAPSNLENGVGKILEKYV